MSHDLRWAAAIAADIEFVRSYVKRYDQFSSNAKKQGKKMRRLQACVNTWYKKYPALKPHPGTLTSSAKRVLPSRLYIEFSNYKHIIKGEAG